MGRLHLDVLWIGNDFFNERAAGIHSTATQPSAGADLRYIRREEASHIDHRRLLRPIGFHVEGHDDGIVVRLGNSPGYRRFRIGNNVVLYVAKEHAIALTLPFHNAIAHSGSAESGA